MRKIKVKPRNASLLLINGWRDGSISLHYNQKWDAIFYDGEEKVTLERDILSIKLDKSLYEKTFIPIEKEK